MITICMNDRQHVLTDCMSSYLYVRKSEYVGYLTGYLTSYLFVFFFITHKLFLLYFSSAQINHLYDV